MIDPTIQHLSEAFVAKDYRRPCYNCGFILTCDDEQGKGNCETSQRTAMSHTLVYRTVFIWVVDCLCPRCQIWNFFDGSDARMFSFSKWTVFSRELLDYWLYGLAVLGATFRESFEMSTRVALSSSARFSRWSSSPLRCTRLQGNKAISAFLRLIEYPAED